MPEVLKQRLRRLSRSRVGAGMRVVDRPGAQRNRPWKYPADGPGARYLTIAAQRGFNDEFLNFFHQVRAFDGSACGRAMRMRRPIVVGDVLFDSEFAPCRGSRSKPGFVPFNPSRSLRARGARGRPVDAFLRDAPACRQRNADHATPGRVDGGDDRPSARPRSDRSMAPGIWPARSKRTRRHGALRRSIDWTQAGALMAAGASDLHRPMFWRSIRFPSGFFSRSDRTASQSSGVP